MFHKGRAKVELTLLIRSGARILNAINFYDEAMKQAIYEMWKENIMN